MGDSPGSGVVQPPEALVGNPLPERPLRRPSRQGGQPGSGVGTSPPKSSRSCAYGGDVTTTSTPLS